MFTSSICRKMTSCSYTESCDNCTYAD